MASPPKLRRLERLPTDRAFKPRNLSHTDLSTFSVFASHLIHCEPCTRLTPGRSWVSSGNKDKVYLYHALALYACLQAEKSGGGGGPFSKRLIVNTPSFNLEQLRSVSRSKAKKNPKTILHLCGNKCCCSVKDFPIGAKIFNHEQTYCHKGLHNAHANEQYLAIQNAFCKHEPRCWAMPYEDGLDLTADLPKIVSSIDRRIGELTLDTKDSSPTHRAHPR